MWQSKSFLQSVAGEKQILIIEHDSFGTLEH